MIIMIIMIIIIILIQGLPCATLPYVGPSAFGLPG